MNLSFGEKILFLRKKKNISQKALAHMLGISASNLTNYEKDRYEPGFKTLIKMAEIFEVTTDFLLKDSSIEQK